MSKNNKREAAKKLMEQIEATDDPKLLVKLTSALARVSPKPKRRKPDEPQRPRKTANPILDAVTGSMLDNLPDGERVLHHLVLQIEAKCRGRGGWNALTRAEKDAHLAEGTKTLSEQERAAIEALNN
jgi:hypothetical protein